MNRRAFLASSLGGLALPMIGRSQTRATLRFVPQVDLAVLDPVATGAYPTRTHGYMVYDTLFGRTAADTPTPQMLAAHTTEQDGLLWRLRLREGLLWHDGTPVLARDCVASIRRWGQRNALGLVMMDATNDIVVEDDRTIAVHLKRPFALLPTALSATGGYMPAMMPEHLAQTDAMVPVKEITGSGPFRFMAAEHVPGARSVYEPFAGYVPRPDGVAEFTAGPKVVTLGRVEWTTIPDQGTAASALQSGEVDWLEFLSPDLAPLFRGKAQFKLWAQDPTGAMEYLCLNHVQPPFDNPAIRRALLGAIDQAQFMQAAVGDARELWHGDVGVFCPGTPMASTAGLGRITGPHDPAVARKAVEAAGYKGERVALMVPQDQPALKAFGDLGAQVMRDIGLVVDYQAVDWGTMLSRRASKAPVGQGGWSAFPIGNSGSDAVDPVNYLLLRANGPKAYFGWPDSPAVEKLRADWLVAPSLAEQKAIAAALQTQALEDVLFIPLGQVLRRSAVSTRVQGIAPGFPVFWGIDKV
jgi:peptide/nickel transport system substrate-binding protein